MTGRDGFAADYNVPRGTMARFDRYAALLAEWQSRMNLVGASTLPDVWDRHFADSAQLVALADITRHAWLDLGAGAGFPGIVVALLSQHRVVLVESVSKKCTFLDAVVQELGLGAQIAVRNSRVEALARFEAGVITARACAPLAQLFDWGGRFAGNSTQWLLPKGATVAEEVGLARQAFDFTADLVPSRTDQRGQIVIATNVRRKA